MAVKQTEAVELYIALFGRAPDGEGLKYWLDQAKQNNWDVKALADNMFYSVSQQYPEYADVQKVVESIYLNVLGKTPASDSEGISYWIQQINEGKTTVGQVAADIIYVAKTQYPDHPATKTLENRVAAGIYTAEKLPKADVNNDGKIDFKVFKKVIELVNSDQASVALAQNYVSSITEENQNVDNALKLTLNTDTIVGTDGNDIINAPVKFNQASGTYITTLNSSDRIDGLGGDDVLTAQLNTDPSKTITPTISNVEKLTLQPLETVTFGFENINGIKEVVIDQPVGNINLQNIKSIIDLYVKDGIGKTVSVNYDNTILGSDADKQKVTIENFKSASSINFNGDPIENFEVTLKKDNDVSLNNIQEIRNLTIDGEGNSVLKVGPTGNTNKLLSVDASKFTGNLNLLDISNSTSNLIQTIKGGSGDDTIRMYYLDRHDKVDLGDGEDKLILKNQPEGFSVSPSVKTEKFYLENPQDNLTLNMANVTDLKSVGFDAVFAGGDDGISKDIVFNNVVNTIEEVYYNVGGVSRDKNLDNVELNKDNITAEDDSITLFITNKDVYGNLINKTPGVQFTIGEFKIPGIENLTIKTDKLHPNKLPTAYDGGIAINSFGAGSGDLINLIIESESTVNLGTALQNHTKLRTIDASKSSGNIYLDVTNVRDSARATSKVTIKTGSGNDTINNIANIAAKTAADYNIDSGAGNDILTVIPKNNNFVTGTGNKTLVLSAGDGDDIVTIQASGTNDDNITTSSVVDLGAGKDLLKIKGNGAIDLSGVKFKNFEEIDINVGNGNIATLDASSFTSQPSLINIKLISGDLQLNLDPGEKLDLTDNTKYELEANSDSKIIFSTQGKADIKLTDQTDYVIQNSPFAAADKITDFKSGMDKLKIDLTKEAAAGAVSTKKFGAVNSLDAAYVATTGSTKNLQIIKIAAKKTAGITAKKINAVSNVAATIGKLFTGNNITFVKNGAGTKIIKIKIDGNSVITKGVAAKTDTGVLFFYDKDDKKLVMYGLVLKDGNSTAAAALTSVVVATHKTIATVTLTSGTLAASDILVF